MGRRFSLVSLGLTALAASLLAACGQSNTYQPPPPPKVTVAKPVEQKVTRYFEATGNAAAVNSANLVARVQGFLTEIKYVDGQAVKKGDHLFTIEPEPYQLKLQQAQASKAAAQATLVQTQADFERQQDLVKRDYASKATYDTSLSNRDNAKAKLLQTEADEQQAQINLGYTKVVAPFDGIVTARQVSIGELVGSGGTQVLATIVQLDPIYVNFTASERDVLHVRDMLYRRKQKASDLLGTEVDVGLQTDAGYPHKGKLDYIAPTVNQGTGTLAARAELPNTSRLMLPGFFVRVRVPLEETPAMLVPAVALGSDQAGRYVLVVNGDNVVEQRKVEVGPRVGEMVVIEKGLGAEDRVVTAGLLRAIPGQKVDPQTQTAAN
ncbi:MAG TPA: efflux RND transporter periplasmic adaptor subunit [Xanthobacteraceae bacterium]|nr:efflux RND transporter periplasmic adaptor subunit [Xanthobacteraceae bacterium]